MINIVNNNNNLYINNYIYKRKKIVFTRSPAVSFMHLSLIRTNYGGRYYI